VLTLGEVDAMKFGQLEVSSLQDSITLEYM
jgi:hypothetical protein